MLIFELQRLECASVTKGESKGQVGLARGARGSLPLLQINYNSPARPLPERFATTVSNMPITQLLILIYFIDKLRRYVLSLSTDTAKMFDKTSFFQFRVCQRSFRQRQQAACLVQYMPHDYEHVQFNRTQALLSSKILKDITL